MIEVNAALFVLLIEGFGVLIVGVSIGVFFSLRRKKMRRDAVKALVSQINKQSEIRSQSTGSFLQETYQLDDDEMAGTIQKIDKSERKFYQKLVDSYLSNTSDAIATMDASVAELIDTYKQLTPKQSTDNEESQQEVKPLTEKIEKLNEDNTRLREELKTVNQVMADMVSEFGNMFGGGSEHDLDNNKVAEKVGIKNSA